MVITIDPGSKEPLYQQIRSQIIEAIARGELVEGDSLPSVRALGDDLGINLHTVNKAYGVLRDEGYLTMRGRAGAVVAPRGSASVEKRIREQDAAMGDDLRKLALACKARGGTRDDFIAEAVRQADNVFGPTASAKAANAAERG